MKIGYYADWLTSREAGVGLYFLNLLEHFTKLAPSNAYKVFSRLPMPQALPAPARHVRPCLPYALTEVNGGHLPLRALRGLSFGRLDLFHSPMTYVPRTSAGRVVVTIHDLTFLVVPETFGHEQLRTNLEYLPTMFRAQHAIVPSGATRADLVARTRFPESRIHVISEGVDHARFNPCPASSVHALRQKYNLNDHYLLCLGTIEPRKNIVRTLRAFDRFCEHNGRDIQLVLCGRKGWLTEPIFATLESLKHRDSVKYLDYVPTADIPPLLSGCTALVYPSLYEGFGLPPLEAMACGAPVITSNVSSLPEVVGDAALMVDPYSEEELYQAMRRMAESESLRSQYRQRGLERAKLFTWDKCARETLAFYGSIL